MPEPKTAEDWAFNCGHFSYGNPYFGEPALCVACARAYARQVGEAVRDEGVKFLKVEARHRAWKPVLPMFRRLIVAMTHLPAELEQLRVRWKRAWAVVEAAHVVIEDVDLRLLGTDSPEGTAAMAAVERLAEALKEYALVTGGKDG